MFERLKFHFSDHGLFYWSALILLSVVVGSEFVSCHDNDERVTEVTKWPTVSARILTSELSETNTSDDVSFSSRLYAKVGFVYEIETELHQVDFVRSWTRSDSKNWDAVLAPGSELLIRVSPENPDCISLFDHNGVP